MGVLDQGLGFSQHKRIFGQSQSKIDRDLRRIEGFSDRNLKKQSRFFGFCRWMVLPDVMIEKISWMKKSIKNQKQSIK
ncbi:hypothetical protein [Deinococcus roseus]|uniref:hypothetical protein n=1 Tax=Deinococcus roseus TaxID=392414 RepID=UPI00166D4A64|nr:hypothetical protein [Deinococcus roseus]